MADGVDLSPLPSPNPRRVPSVLTRAFHIARSGRPGPVVVALPRDMLDETEDMPVVDPYPVIRAHPEPALIQEMVQRLGAAKTPIILAGPGTEYSGARQELIAFCEKFQAPVQYANIGDKHHASFIAIVGTDKQHLSGDGIARHRSGQCAVLCPERAVAVYPSYDKGG